MRKSPIKHKVRAYARKGKTYGRTVLCPVKSYTRGSGSHPTTHLANPTPTYQQKLMPATVQRLLKKLSYETKNQDTTFDELPLETKKALLAENHREQRIIHKFQDDSIIAQEELILDHAKRLVDTGEDTFSAWNKAVGNCRYQYHGGGSLDPFGYEVRMTEEYMDKLEKYAKQHQEEDSIKRLKPLAKEVERQLKENPQRRLLQAGSNEEPYDHLRGSQ